MSYSRPFEFDCSIVKLKREILKYIPVLDVRHVKILDHKSTVLDDFNFSSSDSMI
jgi:hypothetical protein